SASGNPGAPGYQPEKKLWDWLQLLIVPVVLAVGGLYFTARQAQRDKARAKDQTEATALQQYIDFVGDLSALKKPRADDIWKVVTAKTTELLPGLSPYRKGSLLKFLYALRLIDKGPQIVENGLPREEDPAIIRLSGADLNGAYLVHASLGT